MAQQKEQWFLIAAATLFVIGAFFMVLNTFGGLEWAVWVGTGFAVAAILFYITVHIARKEFNKKYKPTESELQSVEQKQETTDTKEPI